MVFNFKSRYNKTLNILLPPAYVVRREGTVFTGVCLSTGGVRSVQGEGQVCPAGGGGSVSQWGGSGLSSRGGGVRSVQLGGGVRGVGQVSSRGGQVSSQGGSAGGGQPR